MSARRARPRLSRLAEPPADPFDERRRPALREHRQLMGARFLFETDEPRLMRLVRIAYAQLPAHRLASAAPRCLVRLVLASKRARPALKARREPPRVGPLAGGGILCGAMENANFVALTAPRRSALIVVSRDMLEFPYHLRYEMLEFAVYVLASRVQGLAPLHAACIGRGGQGILLLGPSGSGKSTLSLHSLLQGLDFLAEDSVLVRPDNLLATGVANFLHVRRDSLRFLDRPGRAALLRGHSIIRRRSGVEKFEIDLRRPCYRLAPAPLRIGAVVFVSPRSAGAGALLVPVPKGQLIRQLAASQRYAAHQSGWSTFIKNVSHLPALELRRGRHPLQAVEALEKLLPSGHAARAPLRARP
ncbi:MAG: hypothetical protein WBF89_05450 [Steroidobacteraceae bacterium]